MQLLNKTLELLDKLNKQTDNLGFSLTIESNKDCFITYDEGAYLNTPDATVESLHIIVDYLERLSYLVENGLNLWLRRSEYVSSHIINKTDYESVFVAYNEYRHIKEFIDNFDYFDYLRKFD